jgi:hypothetical protein
MRLKKGLAGATFLVLGVGGASNAFAQLQLRGSDTLEDVTKDAVSAAGLTASITYVGGGSGAGEAAMVGGTQVIAPMSRALTTSLCVAGQSQTLIVGLDGIAVVAGSQTGGDSLNLTPATTDDCSDTISGGGTLAVPGCVASDGCATAGQYTFASWKEVLALIYGGQNHNTTPSTTVAAADGSCTYVAPPNEATADAACTAAGFPGEVCYPNNKCGNPALVGTRNASRVNCLNPVRQALVDNYGQIFQDVPPTASCRTGTCTKLRHAFRRDDLSGTTDTFVSLVGLTGIANPTKAFANNSPMPDRAAVASPFCNGGERPLNKGDTDYLDLDPIRRAVDLSVVSGNRFGLEQVAELVPAFGGNNNDANCMRGAIPADHASTTQPGIWPDPNIANSQALLQADLGFDSVNGGLLPVPYAPTTRLCLGLVLPITLPANYSTPQQAYFGDATTGAPVACDILDPPGVGPGRAIDSINMDTQHSGTAICPNGTRQPCDLPYKVDPNAPNGRNFNCFQDQLNPNLSGVQDMRVYNVHPVDVTGHYLRDNYLNSSIPGLAAARQARVVSAYYRLHTTRNTNVNGSVPKVASCRQFTSTDQIGCLVKANTCTMGFAGRESVDATLPGANFAIRMEGIAPSTQNIQNLVAGGTFYPISRKLWLNSLRGFSTASAAEVALFNFESNPASIDPIIVSRNFVQVPAGVTRLGSCP